MKRIGIGLLLLGFAACNNSPEPQPQLPAQVAPVVVPSRTKAIRLIVVPDDSTRGDKLRAFALEKRAAKNDVFIVGTSPMSYVKGELIPHAQAISQDAEALPFVSTPDPDPEQVQWESEAEFEITRIEKAPGTLKTMRSVGAASAGPAVPFEALKSPVKGGPGNPVRSGVVAMSGNGTGQLYSVGLAVWVNGQRREISPPAYLFACGGQSLCTVSDKDRSDRRATFPDPVVTNLANRTKVVRLIVLEDGFDRKNVAEVRRKVLEQRAAKSDVFIQGNEVFSYINGELVPHKEATIRDRGTTVFAVVLEREQIQWESNMDFVLTDIRKESNPQFTSDKDSKAPENPFTIVDPKAGAHGGTPRQPLRSGVVDLKDSTVVGQLYKLSFRITINGRSRDIDPDVWCDM